jgi:hypothetical protein
MPENDTYATIAETLTAKRREARVLIDLARAELGAVGKHGARSVSRSIIDLSPIAGRHGCGCGWPTLLPKSIRTRPSKRQVRQSLEQRNLHVAICRLRGTGFP